MAEEKLRPHLDVYLGKVEVGIYCVLATLLLLTALATLSNSSNTRRVWAAIVA